MVMATNESLKSRVNLYVSGRKLKDLDPKCILYEKRGKNWVKMGETETINNNLNPDFQTSFSADYFFEKT